MNGKVLGIHHVTAISGAPHQNYDFYTRVLGLKLVKKTVNFDDPGTYHLYYGDATGSPGSLLTFFPYEGQPGRPGAGQVTVTAYAVPQGELKGWEERLLAHGVSFERSERFGQAVLNFTDHHGMGLEILESEHATSPQLGRFAGAAISLVNTQKTQQLLEFLGYRVIASEDGRTRMAVGEGSSEFLELRTSARGASGGGPGTVHHIALRLPDNAAQVQWRNALLGKGYQVSPVTDRNYFNSIYFRGPEGVLYELATDPPGMLIDEDQATLGTTLRLPPQYEKYREALLDQLAPLETAFHTFERAGKDPMLVGLHGTGGDEHDLVPLLTQLDPEAHLLTLRGQVSENGHARFFRRLREGIFDQRDLAERSQDLASFLTARPEEKVVVGYSNGANIAAHTLMHHPRAFQRAILIRPMLGWTPPPGTDLSSHRVLILIGAQDNVVPPDSGRDLVRALLDLGAHVDVEELSTGHGLTPEDVRLAHCWLGTVPVVAG
jgi:glyoxalase family protein